MLKKLVPFLALLVTVCAINESLLAQGHYTSQADMVKELLARGVKKVSTKRTLPLSAKHLAQELGYEDSARYLGEMSKEGKAIGVPQIRDFVYHWFNWLDRKVPLAKFKVHLSRVSLFISMPGKEIRGTAGFENWYVDFCRQYVNTRHEVGYIHVEKEKTGGFFLEMPVTRKGLTKDGLLIETVAEHTWYVRIGSDGVIRVRRYEVVPAAGKAKGRRKKNRY